MTTCPTCGVDDAFAERAQSRAEAAEDAARLANAAAARAEEDRKTATRAAAADIRAAEERLRAERAAVEDRDARLREAAKQQNERAAAHRVECERLRARITALEEQVEAEDDDDDDDDEESVADVGARAVVDLSAKLACAERERSDLIRRLDELRAEGAAVSRRYRDVIERRDREVASLRVQAEAAKRVGAALLELACAGGALELKVDAGKVPPVYETHGIETPSPNPLPAAPAREAGVRAAADSEPAEEHPTARAGAEHRCAVCGTTDPPLYAVPDGPGTSRPGRWVCWHPRQCEARRRERAHQERNP